MENGKWKMEDGRWKMEDGCIKKNHSSFPAKKTEIDYCKPHTKEMESCLQPGE